MWVRLGQLCGRWQGVIRAWRFAALPRHEAVEPLQVGGAIRYGLAATGAITSTLAALGFIAAMRAPTR